MIEYIVFSIVIFSFILASIEDIKKREVYDYLNFSLSFFIVAVAIFESVSLFSIAPLKYVFFGMLVGFALGATLYYLGIWGGGDAKFLIGFSGASYYLMHFTKKDAVFADFYGYLFDLTSYWFKLFIDTFLSYIIIIDSIAILILIALTLRHFKRKEELMNSIYLIAILMFLFLGLKLELSIFYLLVLGFASFLLIFFAPENLFYSCYVRYKKKLKNLDEGDLLDSSLKFDGKVFLDLDDAKFGVVKEHLIKIDEVIEKDEKKGEKLVILRKVLPYSMIVVLNYVIYILKIISLDDVNLEILGFVSKFLFYSFCVGGIIAILILIYSFVRNFKRLKFKFSFVEKVLLGVSFLVVFGLTLFDRSFGVLFMLPFLYLFMNVAKQLEYFIFVKPKFVDKITPGDWIAQDIIVDKKVIYSVDDFKLGIEEEQIENLKKLAKKHKELAKILVKDGIAFLPPLLIGFVLMFFI